MVLAIVMTVMMIVVVVGNMLVIIGTLHISELVTYHQLNQHLPTKTYIKMNFTLSELRSLLAWITLLFHLHLRTPGTCPAVATEHSLSSVQNWLIASLAFADLRLENKQL